MTKNPEPEVALVIFEKIVTLRLLFCRERIGKTVSRIASLFCLGIALFFGSGTAHAQESLVITAPPPNVQTKWSDHYVSTKYLKIERYNVHILGSPTVSDWFMRESHEVIGKIIDAMIKPEDRAKFWGFQALLITNADPDLVGRGGVPGHRNSGGNGWSLFCEDVVCVTAVDTIRPNDPPEYRGWIVPLHEFGHAVELTLGLQATTRALRFENNEPLEGAYYFETYAWAVANWFSERPVSARAGFAPWEYNYLATVFDTTNTWAPSCEPRMPAGYIRCSDEGGSFTLPGASDVAYGADRKFNYAQNRTGLVTFTPANFGGDPNIGVVKSGFYKLVTPSNNPVGPPGYTWCSGEYGTFTLPGICDLAYGANGAFVFKNARSGTVTFVYDYFKSDPAPSAIKSGFYKLTSASAIPPVGATKLAFVDWASSFNVDGGVDGDSDKDGISNGVEYALQTDPNKSDGSIGTYQGRLISFQKRPATSGNDNLIYHIEVSSDLGKTDPWRLIESIQSWNGIEAVMPQAQQKMFARLRVDIQ
jgi:hypothetical protein